MKLLGIALVAAVASVAAEPHRHAHRHPRRVVVKRNPDATAVYEAGPVETVVVYELNGRPIPEAEVHQGIANGTLMWGADGTLSTSSAAPVATPVSVSSNPPPESKAPSPSPEYKAPTVEEATPSENTDEQTQDPVPDPAPPSPSNTYQPTDASGDCADCAKEFRNDYHPCDEFPSGYGAIPLDQEDLGGWTGIQDPVYRGADGYDDITTVTKDNCRDGPCCTPGNFCSYGCPNPYLKMSWPKTQGKTLQSVGGLYCNDNNKLEMADGSIGKTLCAPGSSHMKLMVNNKLKEPVSICRTDYPGTESMTIPLTLQPGETGELASPDLNAYYIWNDKPTSAHYYVNKKGVSEEEACTWGTEKKGKGNWAPIILGTSYDDGMKTGFTSLQQNELCKEDRADYNIEFTGDGVTSPCKFKHESGEFCEGDKCGRDQACTAAVKEGSTLTLVLSDD